MIAPADALTILAGKLQPGERVLYAVRPGAWVALRGKLFLLWIGIPWCAGTLSLFFAGRASPAVAIPLALVGIAMVAAPVIMAIDRRCTIYAITDRRAMIVHDGLRPAVTSCPFDRMDAVLEILAAGGRSGHLYFASDLPTSTRDVDYTGKMAFRDLSDPQEAGRHLETARKTA